MKQKKLTLEEINILKDKINSEVRRLIPLEKEGPSEELSSNDDGSDEIDQANYDLIYSQKMRFKNRENLYRRKLLKALSKLADGSYGHCEDCDQFIEFKRLFARPTADLCIFCKERSEREESSSLEGRQSKSLGMNS